MRAPRRVRRLGPGDLVWAAVAAAVLTAGCTGGGLPGPVPEDAENPVELRVRGATPPEIVGALTRAFTGLAIQLRIADGSRGYIESEWIDVASYQRAVGPYPDRERIVQYQVRVVETDTARVRRIQLAAVYRPLLTDRDRLVPTDHPGYQLAIRLRDRMRIQLIEANIPLVEEPTGETGETEEKEGKANGGR